MFASSLHDLSAKSMQRLFSICSSQYASCQLLTAQVTPIQRYMRSSAVSGSSSALSFPACSQGSSRPSEPALCLQDAALVGDGRDLTKHEVNQTTIPSALSWGRWYPGSVGESHAAAPILSGGTSQCGHLVRSRQCGWHCFLKAVMDLLQEVRASEHDPA